MKNSKFHTNDVKSKCESKLKIKHRKGKELNGWFVLDGKKTARITIPKGRKPIPPKTYKSMALQLKLTTAEFDNLLECPLTLRDYKEILKK